MKNPRIGFIGLGIMGRPMAQNLLKAGFQLTVYNRSKPAVDLLVSAGALSAPSPKAVAERSDVVITMVTDSEAVDAVVLGAGGVIEGAHEGLVLIDMSTISPSVTRSVSASLAGKGVSMLDAPVSGGDTGARAGDPHNHGGRSRAGLRSLPAGPPGPGEEGGAHGRDRAPASSPSSPTRSWSPAT